MVSPVEDAPGRFPSVATPADPSAGASATPAWRRNAPLIAVLGLLALVVAGLGYLSLGAGTSATAAAYAYVAQDAPIVGELRLDMPSGQRAEVIDLLSHFPGFENDLLAVQRLNDLFESAVDSIAGEDADYGRDVAPWFGEWVVVAGWPAEEAAGVQPGHAVRPRHGLVVLGNRDRDEAAAALERLRPAGPWTSTQVGAQTVWTNADAAAGTFAAYAVTDDVVLLADRVDQLNTALAVRAGEQPNLLAIPGFAAWWRALPAGRLAAAWIDVEATGDLLSGWMGAIESPLPSGLFGGACTALPEPATHGAVVYVRDGRLTADLTTTYADGAALPALRDSGLDNRLPADTFLYAEQRDLGAGIGRLVDCVRDGPGDAPERLAELERRLGPLDELLGWAGDTALAARFAQERVSLGLVVRVTDDLRAAEAIGQLRASLVGMGEPGEVQVTEEAYGGVRVVDIALGDQMGEHGPAGPQPVVSYAFTDGLLVIGIDGSFTRAVLDTSAQTSLRSRADYRAQVEAGGGFSHAGLFHVDVVRAMDVAAAFDLGAASAQGDEEFLRAIAGLTAVSRTSGRSVVLRVVVTPAD